MKKIKRTNYYIYILGLFITIILATTIGVANINFLDTLKIIFSRLPFFKNFIDLSSVKDTSILIVLSLRLPRVILACLVGIALSTSGVVFQAIFKNPMADPYILGISSGAAFGATLVLISSISFSILGLSAVSLGAFIGAICTTFLVLKISDMYSNKSVVTLLLAGLAISFFLSALINLLMTLNHDKIESIVFWTMGSLTSASWQKIMITFFPVSVGVFIFWYFRRDLNVLLMGNNVAKNLGLNVDSLQKILLITASIVTASAVAVSGIIGFVGLIIPHAIRLIVGPNHQKLLGMTIFGGAFFMIVADSISKILIQPMEIPIGVITALIGAPYFIFLLIKNTKKIN